jgi:hypothetical protein
VVRSAREKAFPRHSHIEDEKKKSIINITKPSLARRNIIHFGHESWNLMLNMMLGTVLLR